jgi:hypothetical protein
MGGVNLLVDLCNCLQPAEAVIVADRDAPGQRGAENLSSVLVAYMAAVRVIVPPEGVKDAREWKATGATSADVMAAIDAAEPRKLAITTHGTRRRST